RRPLMNCSRRTSMSHLSHCAVSSCSKAAFARPSRTSFRRIRRPFFALCYLDLYKLTRAVLELLKPRLVRGSVLIFDEVLNPDYPGETVALNEIFGISNTAL